MKLKKNELLVLLVMLAILTIHANIAGASGIRYITIGDVHITNDTNNVQYKSLVQAVNYINNRTDIDIVVELGDITDTSKDNNFITAKSVLDGLNKPYYIVEGNHDYGINGSIFEKYFGPSEHIENINGYQLIFVGIKENNSIHWSFNYSNVDKTLPTIIFNHGPVQPDIDSTLCERSWKDSLHRYSCDMKPNINNFTNLLGFYSGHVHKDTEQMINGTLYITAKNLEGNDFIGHTIIQDGVVNYTIINTSIPWTPTVEVTPVPTVLTPNKEDNSGGHSGSNSESSGSNSESSGSNSGGGGLSNAEPYENIYKYEIQEMAVFTTPVSFKYRNPELAVYEVMVTSTQSDMASLRIEVLKGTSKLVNTSAPGIVYKNINAWIDYKRIKNATMRFKVDNSWMNSNGLSGSNIKMSKWDTVNKKWIELLTIVTNKDDAYTYFESQTDTFSSFVINGIKDENVISNDFKESNIEIKGVKQADNTENIPINTENIPINTENIPINTENPKTSGFGIVSSIVIIISILYLVRRIRYNE